MDRERRRQHGSFNALVGLRPTIDRYGAVHNNHSHKPFPRTADPQKIATLYRMRPPQR